MKTQNTPHLSKTKGFAGFIEVFKAGVHKDSNENSATWTRAHLDEMISYAEKNPIPIVIGHPKTNHPAYGWVKTLKRDGDTLLAKFHKLNTDFKVAVESGSFLNRSIRISKSAKGFQLRHVGFLGGVPPAIKGLKPIEFSNDNSEHFDFETNNSPKDTNMTDEEVAAKVAAAKKEGVEEAKAAFAEKRIAMQSEIDDLNVERALTAHKTIISSHINRGVAPALLEGATDFMATLDDEAEFEFSQGEGDKAKKVKAKQLDFVKTLLNALPAVASMTETDFSGGDWEQFDFAVSQGSGVDENNLMVHNKANSYMLKHDVDYLTAVKAVSK